MRAKVLYMAQTKGIADSSNKCVECDYGISTFAEPMVIRQNVADPDVLEVISSYGIALIAMIAFSFVPASSIIYLIQERKNEEKQVRRYNHDQIQNEYQIFYSLEIYEINKSLYLILKIFQLNYEY